MRKLNVNTASFMLFMFAIMLLVSTCFNSTSVDTNALPINTGAGLACEGDSRYMYAGLSSEGECMFFDTERDNTMVLDSER